jgi:CBS domain containing-hemolysin-like protein
MIWLLLLLLLACSATASASETSLFALSDLTLQQFRVSTSLLQRRVYRLMREPRRVLMTVLIANTAVNVAIFAVSYEALRVLQPAMPALAAAGSLGVLLAVVVFGEILPKAAALSAAKRIAPIAAMLISGLQIVLAPLQWVLSVFLVTPITRLLAGRSSPSEVTTEELNLLVDQSALRGEISSLENRMLQAVVALGDASVREVMTARVDIHAVRIGDPPDVIRARLAESRPRKLPVCGKDLDDIRGLLHARDFYLNPGRSVESLLKPIHFVPEQVRLFQLIRHFRKRHIQFAIVVDEYGGTVGLVSMEDVLERIVGNLSEHDAPPEDWLAERIDDNTYRLPGDFSVRDWAHRFAAGEVDERIDTLAGLVLSRLGRMPRKGDKVRIRNLTLTVDAVSRHRIERILLRREDPKAAERSTG